MTPTFRELNPDLTERDFELGIFGVGCDWCGEVYDPEDPDAPLPPECPWCLTRYDFAESYDDLRQGRHSANMIERLRAVARAARDHAALIAGSDPCLRSDELGAALDALKPGDLGEE